MRFKIQICVITCALTFMAIGIKVAGQTRKLPPVQYDPLELATGPVEVADSPDKRGAILGLLERARQNNNLHIKGMAPFHLKASFNVVGSDPSNGFGELEEMWANGSAWRWNAHLGNYSQSRVLYRGVAYDASSQAYQPLRLGTVRQAIFWPVSGNFVNDVIRVANTMLNGKAVTCALISGPRAEATTVPGRQWHEEEYCIDPKSGLLQSYSVAPGIYSTYDYSNALTYHGHTIAREITIVEAGNIAAQVHIESLQDLSASESLFTPTPEMKSPGILISEPIRFPQFAKADPAVAGTATQPIIVHATLDIEGKVLEAEALQLPGSPISDAALLLVKNTNYGPSRAGRRVQRDVFINVQFATP
jgi:hypothetical protein